MKKTENDLEELTEGEKEELKLRKFIKKHKEDGFSEDHITRLLVKKGYDKDIIGRLYPQSREYLKSEEQANNLKVIVGIVFAFIVLVWIFYAVSLSQDSTPRTQYQPQRVYVDKSYKELKEIFRGSSKYTDIQKDKIFDEQLKGRYVKWNGKINDIDTSMLDNLRLYVNIKENILFDDTVRVYMNKDQYQKLIILDKGDDVTFSGRFDSYTTILGVTFFFKDGEFIEPEPEKPKSCTDECTESKCVGTTYYACIIGTDGCKHEEQRGVEFGRCGIECEEDSNCKKAMECVKYKCVEKPKTTATKTTTEDTTRSSGGFLDGLANAINEVSDSLEKSSAISSKIDECTRLCADDDYDIPLIKNECSSSCYQMYYALGEDGLNDMINDLK